MRTLALDPATGDLALSGGRPTIVSGSSAVAQRLRMRLKLWRGEWALDTQVGFPWQRIFGVKGVERLTETLLRQAITSCPGVKSLDRFTFGVNPSTRAATLTFTVTPITGELVTISDFAPGDIGSSLPVAA